MKIVIPKYSIHCFKAGNSVVRTEPDVSFLILLDGPDVTVLNAVLFRKDTESIRFVGPFKEDKAVASCSPDGSALTHEQMGNGIRGHTVVSRQAVDQIVVTVQYLDTLSESTNPQFTLPVAQDAMYHVVGQLIVDAVLANKPSVCIAEHTALRTDPHLSVGVFIETSDVKIGVIAAYPIHLFGPPVIHCYTVQVHPQPQVTGTVSINDIDMGIPLYCFRSQQSLHPVLVEYCYLVFTTQPQTAISVYIDTPHLLIHELTVTLHLIGQRTEQRLLMTDDVYTAPIVTYPDVSKRVLEHTTGVG